jgi:DNA-binding transcriptional regulator GbsR (MarR family)
MQKIDKDLKQDVENIGIIFERGGFPPMPSRVLGYLLMAEPPYRSFDEIVDFLQASKSAISNALKFLEMQGLVVYITFSGDRKRYFKLNFEKWLSIVNKPQIVRMFRETMDHILAKRSDQYPEFNRSVEDIRDLYKLIEEELPKIIEKWEASRKKRNLQ